MCLGRILLELLGRCAGDLALINRAFWTHERNFVAGSVHNRAVASSSADVHSVAHVDKEAGLYNSGD